MLQPEQRSELEKIQTRIDIETRVFAVWAAAAALLSLILVPAWDPELLHSLKESEVRELWSFYQAIQECGLEYTLVPELTYVIMVLSGAVSVSYVAHLDERSEHIQELLKN